MPIQSSPDSAFSHWHRLLGGLEGSTLEFYEQLEGALETRDLPDSARSRVDHQESGPLSAKREYLQVRRGRFSFDVCAAPFGAGFFVSWWLGEPRPAAALPTIVALAAFGAGVYYLSPIVGLIMSVLVCIGVVLAILWIVGSFLPENQGEAYIIVIPLVGALYEKVFRPSTYYRQDTALMFQSAVHGAVLEVVDRMTEAKGVRPLTELERKPTMREFYQR